MSDLLQPNAKTVDTREREVWYFHNSPLNIQDTDRDTVTVEVFEVPEGATTIPAGAEPIARMGAEVRGDERNLDSRIRIEYGQTPSGLRGGERFECALMSLYFKPAPGAKTYVVRIQGVGGRGADYNWNQDFKYRGPNHSVLFDPSAVYVPPSVPAGLVYRRDGACDFITLSGDHVDGFGALAPYYDPVKDEFSLALFGFIAFGDDDPYRPLPPLEYVIDLWHEWLKDATFEVVVNR